MTRKTRERAPLGALVILAALVVAPVPEAAAQAGCDLTAQFNAPDSPQPRSNAVEVSVTLRNQGSTACNKNRVTVNAFNGTTAGGYARMVGGSAGGKQLPALEAGAEVTLEYKDNVGIKVGPPFQVTYALKYSAPHNDANNNTPRPTRTGTYQ